MRCGKCSWLIALPSVLLWGLLSLAVLTSLAGIMVLAGARNVIVRRWQSIFNEPSPKPRKSPVRTPRWLSPPWSGSG